VAAIEQENILLLTKLMNSQNHSPETPVDKLGNNILHMACYMGKLNMVKYIYNNFRLPLDLYNTDGLAPIHLAVKSGNPEMVEWLWEQGVDCHIPTQVFGLTPLYIIGKMIWNKDYYQIRKRLLKIQRFLKEKYFQDKRGWEVRKFLWIALKLKEKNEFIGKLPFGLITEIGKYI
jgi:ankyrin repeat protein